MTRKTKKQKTSFGKFLQQYREDKRLSQLALERLLDNSEYPITNGLVNRYESGERTPPPRFIHKVSKVLVLNDEQTKALIEAHFADNQVKFWTEYNSDSR
jgi:transcriptional regulator with XRE-family HTH domain